jgi:hypothetical protein
MATQLGFKASLIPGKPQLALPRVAHKFGTSDLIIINGGLQLSNPTVGPIGGWLNRIAHSRSTVMACEQADEPLTIVPREALDLPVVKVA